MKTKSRKEGSFLIAGVGIGTVTREMIGKRAAELALINGHSGKEPTMADWDEAERELTGGSEHDMKQELLESVPESGRWNLVHASPGHEAPASFNDGEDDEGRSPSERLVTEGVEEAGHDQMLQSAISRAESD